MMSTKQAPRCNFVYLIFVSSDFLCPTLLYKTIKPRRNENLEWRKKRKKNFVQFFFFMFNFSFPLQCIPKQSNGTVMKIQKKNPLFTSPSEPCFLFNLNLIIVFVWLGIYQHN